MRTWVGLFLILFTFMLGSKVPAATKGSKSSADRDGFSAYAALGENLRPFSFRIGYSDWEMGMLNGFFGFDKFFHLNDSFYSAFGFAATTTVGVYGAVGWKAHLWFIPIRCELATIMDTKALTQSGGLIGVSYGF